MNSAADLRDPEVLVIHGDVYGFGGAENHCVRIAEILQDLGCRVTVLHAGGPLDAERIFQWCGIRLDPARVKFLTAPIFARHPALLRGMVLLRYAFVLRAASRIADRYDLVVGTYGEVPLRVQRLIQSTHVPLFFHDAESLEYLGFDAGRSRIRHALRALYVVAARRICGWNKPAIERGMLMLSNSKWTAGQFQRHYPAANPKVVYHGARTEITAGCESFLPFESRRDNFVVLGRVVAAKRVDAAIGIVDALRAEGRDVGLIIVGNGEGAYAEKIAALVADRPHVSWRKNLSRGELERVVAGQKWGLHCAPNEHYGLAAIELLRLGCIVFVPDSGGQAEVVADARLRYRDASEAQRKIAAVLDSAALQCELRSRLLDVVSLHTIERFRADFSAHIVAALNKA